MRSLLILPASALLALSALTSCVEAPRAPAPVAAAPPRVVAPPAPAAPAVVATDWRDRPQTPGDWRYQTLRDGSVATFGTPPTGMFALQCVKASREVMMIHHVAVGGPTTIRTTSLTRTLSFQVEGDPPGGSVITRLPATDPLLDAIGFSRGRFVVEQAGAPPLVLPAWAEVERVVEDCRG